MIKVINSSRLTRQPFFHELINYLDRHDDVTLREIKCDRFSQRAADTFQLFL